LVGKARNYVSAASTIHGDLASAYALLGETQRAPAELAEARWLSSDDRYSSLAGLRDARAFPKIRALYEATYVGGLRKDARAVTQQRREDGGDRSSIMVTGES
jgi:hypothetical protein